MVAVVKLEPVEPTKVCSKCHTELPLSRFDGDRTRKSGKASQCKACRAHPRTPPRPKLETELWMAAAQRLIEIHPVMFNKLLYTEKVRRGLIDPVSEARKIR